MKKLLLLFTAVLLFSNSNFAQQYKNVTVNFEKTYFGENEPLPAAQNFMLTGQIKADIPYMEVAIYSGKGVDDKKPVYTTSWKRELNSDEMDFDIPINTTLRPGSNYDIHLKFFREVAPSEKEEVRLTIMESLNTYLDQSFQGNTKKISLSSSHKQIMSDMESIVRNGLSFYRPRTDVEFKGFSDMVGSKIKEAEGMKLKNGSSIEMGDMGVDSRLDYREQVIADLKTLIENEVQQYMNVRMYIQEDDVRFDGYPTEKMKSTIALNAGYGGAIFNMNGSNFNYGSAPYLGVAMPFGREGVTSPFWARTSVSAGAFLMNFKDTEDKKVSGPIFRVPTYVGLGYRFYKFLKFNASVAFLEDADDAGISGFKNKVEFRPMIGLSAEFNFWLDLAK